MVVLLYVEVLRRLLLLLLSTAQSGHLSVQFLEFVVNGRLLLKLGRKLFIVYFTTVHHLIAIIKNREITFERVAGGFIRRSNEFSLFETGRKAGTVLLFSGRLNLLGVVKDCEVAFEGVRLY